MKYQRHNTGMLLTQLVLWWWDSRRMRRYEQVWQRADRYKSNKRRTQVGADVGML